MLLLETKAGKFPVWQGHLTPGPINDKTGCHHPPPHPCISVLQSTQEVTVEHTPATPGQAMVEAASPPILGSRARLSCFHFQILISFLGSVYIFCTETFLWFIYWNIATGLNLCLLPPERMIWFATSRFSYFSINTSCLAVFLLGTQLLPASLNNEAGLN